jgi:multidrug transporter EmrE-like cation transporter
MKTLGLYSLAAIMYVSGGAFMKYSQGLTRALPTVGLTVLFSAGALIQARAMRHEELGTSYILVLGLEALLASQSELYCSANKFPHALYSGSRWY